MSTVMYISQKAWAETELILNLLLLWSGKFGIKNMAGFGHKQCYCCKCLGIWELENSPGRSRLCWHLSLRSSELKPQTLVSWMFCLNPEAVFQWSSFLKIV